MKDYEGFSLESFAKDFPSVHRWDLPWYLELQEGN